MKAFSVRRDRGVWLSGYNAGLRVAVFVCNLRTSETRARRSEDKTRDFLHYETTLPGMLGFQTSCCSVLLWASASYFQFSLEGTEVLGANQKS